MNALVTTTWPHAFERAVLDAMPRLRRTCYALAREAADDLVQETLIRALRSWESFVPGTNLPAWLSTIARNLFLSGKRRDWRMTPMPEGLAERQPVDCDPIHLVELKRLLQMMTFLPYDQREALEAVALFAEDYEAVSSELGVPVGTIKSRVSRARKALLMFMGRDEP